MALASLVTLVIAHRKFELIKADILLPGYNPFMPESTIGVVLQSPLVWL
jgi:hypothetical protein